MSKKILLFFIILAAFVFAQSVSAQNATLYFSPSTGTFSEGESFWLTIMVDTKGVAVNAVAAYFSYPEDKLESLGVNITGSAMSIFAEKEAKSGRVKIAGGESTPGFSGVKKIASVGFRAKVSSGSVNFKFSEDSAVLTDAENKNILNLSISGQGNYTFKPKVAAPPPTAPPPTIPPPTIPPAEGPQVLVISGVEVVEITQTEVTISWLTDIEASSLVEYGQSADYGLSVSDENFTKEHSLKISELLPAALYHFKVKSSMAAGQESETDDLTFSTLGYRIEIQVLDSIDRKPLVSAEVIPRGLPQATEITDQEGRVIFEDLPSGKQWIAVKYGEVSQDYQIEILEKEEVQVFEIQFRVPESKKNIFWLLGSILIISSLIAIAWTLIEDWFLRKKQSRKF